MKCIESALKVFCDEDGLDEAQTRRSRDALLDSGSKLRVQNGSLHGALAGKFERLFWL